MTCSDGRLRSVESRLRGVHRRLTESASFEQVLDELNLARAELVDFQARPDLLDRAASIQELENARRQLRFISLAARNLIDLRVGLAGCSGSGLTGASYLPGSAAPQVPSGRHVNLEA
jgi:hypothetical protein